jgi:glycosyltransferase involved in cell wall biosynthesis
MKLGRLASVVTDSSSPPRAPCVAFLIDRWDPQRGGAERAMAQLAEHLLARGWRVLAVAAEHAADAPGEHVHVGALGVTRVQRERRLARALVAAARERGAEVTIGCRHLYECDLYWPHGGAHRPAMLAARESRKPRPRWWPTHPRHRAFIEFERALLDGDGARKVACVSRMVMDELAREWPACRERLVLIENGVDLTRFHPGARAMLGQRTREELGVRPSAVMLVLAARNPWLKGLETLLAALTRVLRDHWLDWQLVVAGSTRPPGWSANARGMSQDARFLCAPGRVIWREHVDGPALFAAADLCVLPSWRDPSPGVRRSGDHDRAHGRERARRRALG